MPQSQLIILLVAAGVALVIFVRLFMILGRKGDAEPPPRVPGWAGGGKAATVEQPDQVRPIPAPTPVAQAPGLFDIQLADKAFDAGKFLDGARAAYGLIVPAFEKGDREALRPLVSKDVLEGFSAAIAERGDAPARYQFSSVRDAKITGASVQDGMMEITVAFVAAFETAEGVGAPHEVTDHWTFQRAVGSADPNWTLVATSGEDQ